MGRQGRHRPAARRRRLSLPARRDRRRRPPAREPRAHARDLDRRATRRGARRVDPRPQLRPIPMPALPIRLAAALLLVIVPVTPVAAPTSGGDAAPAVRRARHGVDGPDARAPWLTSDPRARPAGAFAALLGNRPGDAVAAIGDHPQQPAAAYVRALALRRQGALLKAAAGFQDVADRWPDSPLRDAARFAEADAFLAAHQDKSASEEFARVAARAQDDGIRAEAELRTAGAVLLAGAPDSALVLLRGIVARRAGTAVAA